MAVPVPAYTGERVRLGFGEQLLAAALEVPVAATTWIGKLRPGTISGFGPKNIHDQKYFSGDGRLPTERVLHGVDIGPISFTYELQNGIFLALLLGNVADVGTDQPTLGGGGVTTAIVNPGDTTVTVDDRLNYVVGEFIEIGNGGPAATDPSEIRKITATGAGAGAITVETAFRRSHVSGTIHNEVIAPFTHTLFVGTNFPHPFTIQGTWNAGDTDEVTRAFAGCHGQEIQLSQDLDGELLCTPTIVGSKPSDVAEPASLATPLTTPSYLFSQTAYTYSSLPAVDGVQSWTANIRNGGSMRRHSRGTDAEFGAEYIPDHAEFDHELTKIARRDDSWDALLNRTDPVTGDILYTRGANDTFKIDFTKMVILQADADNPEGGFEETVSFLPGEIQLVFVDSIGVY